MAIAPVIIKSINAETYLRDITWAYVKSTMSLNQTIYTKIPKELAPKYTPGITMRVIKPLYGIAESGLFWWATYHHHHRDKMKMITSILGMQTDDTLILATPEFSTMEEMKLIKALTSMQIRR